MYKPFKFVPIEAGEYIVIDVNYHRNGVAGEGFMTGIFSRQAETDESENGTFVFTLFQSYSGRDEEDSFDKITGDYRCAVLRLEDVNSGTVQNAWRGDYFYSNVVKYAVKSYQEQMDEHFRLMSKTNKKEK